MFLKTIAESEATGAIAEIYAKQKAQMGFVMETAKCMTTRPDLLPVYMEFVAKVRGGFSLGERGWKLITFIVAKHVPSTYCSMVYGQQLVADLGSKEKVLAVQRDFRHAGLSQKDVAMLAYAEKIALEASRITQADVDRVRAAGFTDHEICDIALCAAFRCFISRFFDATGAGPEPAYIDADETFRKAMTVGKAA
jgi:uncharacterized peroxidase-related enzyme